MLAIGQLNRLQVAKEVDFGWYLATDDRRWEDVLLPRNSGPPSCAVGEWLDVFIHFDSEDRIIATTVRPRAMVGEFGFMRVAAVENVGAFLDWGLPKDLLVPFREQKIRLQVGRWYVVRVYQDEGTGRIVASPRLERFLGKEPAAYEVGDAVALLVAKETDLGYKAVINNAHWGFLFRGEVNRRLNVGERLTGYVRNLREDGKIDLSLTAPGYDKVGGIAEAILALLRQRNGFLPLTATTSPEDIHTLFGVSKKSYKMALGALYRQRLVVVEDDGIRLVDA